MPDGGSTRTMKIASTQPENQASQWKHQKAPEAPTAMM
jgi:hypothetical protein